MEAQSILTEAAEPRERSPGSGALLAGLTPEQAAAVCHQTGPLLIVAGPGAGKTRTLIHRIAWLLEQGLAKPWEILAVTFSVRAAGELRLRLAELLGQERAAAVRAATFHSVCARMLREHAGVFGRTGDYTVYDQAEVKKTIDWVLSDRQRGAIQAALGSCGQPGAAEILKEISLAKARMLDATAYEQHATHPAGELVGAVWREVEQELRQSNAFDFDDLVTYAVRLLGERPHVLALYRARWQWLLVDEFQDTCHSQAALVALLAAPDGNACWCGDDDQLLYSFRGADAKGLARLVERFPGHRRIVLARNFRSRAEIVSAAAVCVANNPDRVPKALLAVRGAGGEVRAVGFGNEQAEAAWIAATIGEALAHGTAPGEVLVLSRSAYASTPTQRALASAGIKHRVLGSLGLYERSEVRDALAYLTLIANPRDKQALERAIASPRRGIGAQGTNAIAARARERHNGDLIAACADPTTAGEVRAKAAGEALSRFGRGMAGVREQLRGRSLGHVSVAAVTLDGGLVRHFEGLRDNSPSAERRRDAEKVLEDLRSLCRAASAYEEQDGQDGLRGFLEHARGLHAQEIEPGQEDRRITVSTIHRAKGTEAALVILAGCEERVLPSWRSLESAQLEEERRLFYVAATRAKDRLLITHAAERGGRPSAGPSRFLTEAGLLGAGRAVAA